MTMHQANLRDRVLVSSLVFGSCLLAMSACAPSVLSVKEGPSGRASEADRALQFDTAFGRNVEAASAYYWHAIDCKTRNELTGMPTSAISFPGATGSFIDATEYTATYVFRAKQGAQEALFASVRERFKANLPHGFEHDIADSSGYEKMAHATSSDDFISISLRLEADALMMTFRPKSNGSVPDGNPCIKPNLALMTARFDAMMEAVEGNDEVLFKAQWHAEGYEHNLVGGSGVSGSGVFRQASHGRWVIEPDMTSARNLPQQSADAWIVSCAVVSLAEQRPVDAVWILIADGKVLGGGEDRDDVQTLGWRWANKRPLAPEVRTGPDPESD
jgi:hypothetical protein